MGFTNKPPQADISDRLFQDQNKVYSEAPYSLMDVEEFTGSIWDNGSESGLEIRWSGFR